MAIEAPAAPAENSVPITETQAAPVEGGATQTAEGQALQGQGTAPEEKLSIMGVEIEKSKVPAELLEKVENWNKSYTEKSQKLSEAEKKAQALDQLANNPRFVDWYQKQIRGEAEPAKEDPFKLTPERQAELLSDPGKMQEYIKGLATSVMNEVALPAAKQAQYEAQVLRSEREVEGLASKYQDFNDLNDNGKIEEVVARYAKKGVDIDLEDAYWLAKRPFAESEATLKAHQRVTEKVQGNTLPPSGSPPAGNIKVIPGKGLSFEERLRIALEHGQRNEKIKFDS